MWSAIVARLLRWCTFSVVVALTPIVYRALSTSKDLHHINFYGALSNGELSLVTVVLCAAAIGEVVGTGDRYKIPKIAVCAATTVILMLAAYHFGDISGAPRPALENATSAQSSIANVSVLLFALSIPTCIGCIVLGEVNDGI